MTTSLSVIRTKNRIIISRLSRMITIGVGDIEGRSRSYLRLDYMPSAILFVDHSDQDAFNQLIHLEGGYSTGRLTVEPLRGHSDTRIGKPQQLLSIRQDCGQTPTQARLRG